MPSPIVPKALETGATIAFISPSARLNDELPDVMSRATALLSGRGYQVRTFFNKDEGIQSGINNRLSEIRAAFSDPSISAIICTIGGPCFNELLPALIADTELHGIIRANPKIVVGYSDISGLHWFLYAMTGLRTFYGPGAIPELGGSYPPQDENSPLAFSVKHLFRAIATREPLGDIPRSMNYAPREAAFFLDPPSTKLPDLAPSHPWTWIRPGKAQGRLFGGCLTVVARLLGVRAVVPQWKDRIVFVETAMGDNEARGVPLGRVRAAFADLIAAGVFEEAAGLVVGRAFGYDSEEARDSYAGVIRELLCEGRLAERKFPILFNVDIGHTEPLVTLPYDALAVLDSENDKFAVIESGVV
ncbi:peptidase u61 ld-carboxypeptidase a [Dactylonectria estremocensis]|uniref:Peptidase u61 ld-carboxypeptidase a n=1 Tax=Dactylonectria estremocensis TaxID=1079267 RepID=A0A9P9E5Y7_9HYPO|nr:peptidase u61 ld-carboxypeptidase a [Dactylonectria estremocensis]